MINYKNDTHAVFDTFLDDITDTSKPFLLHYFQALNEAGTVHFKNLVQASFPEYFKKMQDTKLSEIAA